MKSIKGTQTEQNIKAALQGESLARNTYTFFGEKAKEDGYEDIAALFERMGRNETAHARIWYKLLNNGMKDTDANIQEAAYNENSEWRSMYPEFAQKAREEGLDEIADIFERVALIEKDHERSFLSAFVQLKSGQTITAVDSQKPTKTIYRCMFCGAVHDTRPDVCPVCSAIGSFEKEDVNV